MTCSIMVRAIPRPGQDTRLKTLASQLAEAARVEPGTIRFDALSEKGGSVVLMAEYESPEAYDAHMQAPHTQAFRKALERIAEGSGATVTPLARLA
ncbi:antibiotic biosynthesis monooxygenase [Salipiger bermudensis]|uniref:putative quinol monooxygenase n=1 Tax=Salipiger bermudensis TaxID=344736 RepID=UPI001C9951A7|nr:antibiotic biosynthesis monooxygenase [Salipiger bermudensis]MBY6006231.1 antibiotic biosynthesis monooxygenase [Salipiger bermudensis]